MLKTHYAHLAVILVFLCLITSCSQSETGTTPTTNKQADQAQESKPKPAEAPTAAQLDKCRKDVRTGIKLGMIDSYRSESGFRHVVVGQEWNLQTFETKSAVATMLGVCLYLGQPDANEPHLVGFFDRYSGKQIGHLFHGQLQPED